MNIVVVRPTQIGRTLEQHEMRLAPVVEQASCAVRKVGDVYRVLVVH